MTDGGRMFSLWLIDRIESNRGIEPLNDEVEGKEAQIIGGNRKTGYGFLTALCVLSMYCSSSLCVPLLSV